MLPGMQSVTGHLLCTGRGIEWCTVRIIRLDQPQAAVACSSAPAPVTARRALGSVHTWPCPWRCRQPAAGVCAGSPSRGPRQGTEICQLLVLPCVLMRLSRHCINHSDVCQCTSLCILTILAPGYGCEAQQTATGIRVQSASIVALAL